MPEPLTPTEDKVYRYLLAYLAEHSYQPSVREIGREFDIKSTKTVSDILGNLARKGWVQRNRARSRGLTILGAHAPGATVQVPLHDRLPTDGAAPSPDDREDWVTVDRRLVPNGAAYFIRIAGGDAPGAAAGALALVDPHTAGATDDLVAVRRGDRAEVVMASSGVWGRDAVLGRVSGLFRPAVESAGELRFAAD
jgi:repressor LexA